MSRGASRTATAEVEHEGRRLRLELTGCRVNLGGEFAGNVDVDIRCDPALRAPIMESLRLQVPGDAASEESIAYGVPDDHPGVSLVFHSAALARATQAPESLTLLWREEPVAALAPELVGSTAVERVHRWIDPAEILPSPRIPTSDPVRIAAERQLMWLLPAMALAATGIALLLLPDGLLPEIEGVPYRSIAGVADLVVAVGLAYRALGVPRRQVWYERARQRLVVVEGSAPPGREAFDSGGHRELSEFSHVRICERRYAPSVSDDHDRDRAEWIVCLEGDVPFAGEDGRVHLRDDALVLARAGTSGRARLVAAAAGHSTGLRILEATDW